MSGRRWSKRPITSRHEQALVFCADFAAECRRLGDMSNHYRWRMVMHENRRYAGFSSSPLPKGNTMAQLPLM